METDIELSKRVLYNYNILKRKYVLMFKSKEHNAHSLKNAPMNYLISELKYRNNNNKFFKFTNIEIIRIIETEILYRRKEKIDKIKQNINI